MLINILLMNIHDITIGIMIGVRGNHNWSQQLQNTNVKIPFGTKICIGQYSMEIFI